MLMVKYLCSSIKQMFAPSFKTRYLKMLEGMPLARFEKDIIIERYVNVVTEVENDYMWTRILYNLLTNVITLAGVLITVSMPLDKIDAIGASTQSALFWTAFALSIILNLSNKWLTAFNINKKYVLNIATLEKFHTEGWSFMAGIGRYKQTDISLRFKLFCARVEQIKMKSLESMPEMESADGASGILGTSAPGGSQLIDIPGRITRRNAIVDCESYDLNADADVNSIIIHVEPPQVAPPQRKVSISGDQCLTVPQDDPQL